MTRKELILLFIFISPSLLAQELKVISLKKNIHVHVSSKILSGAPFPSNGLLVETSNGVFVVDTPWDIPQTEQLIKWVDENIRKPITHCVVTHWHDDRVTGVRVLKEKYGTKILAYSKTADKLVEIGYGRPDVILPQDSVLIFDGIRVNTFYPGEGHTTDNIVVWIAKQKILFGGCFVKSTESKTLGNIADASLNAWPESVRRVQKKFKKPLLIIPGHQSWESPKSLEHTLRLLEEKKN